MNFNDDMIKRNDLPLDAHRLIHDLCYHHEGRDVQTYVRRAQEILSSPTELHEHFYEDDGKCKCGQSLDDLPPVTTIPITVIPSMEEWAKRRGII